jgi:branched-chain amino acid transport system permease protein
LARQWAISPSRGKPTIWRGTAVVLTLAVLLLLPLVVRDQYYLHILVQVIINAVLAMTFVIVLRTGLINVSMAAFWGLGAYGVALLETKAGLSFWAAAPISVVGTFVLALLIGLIVVRFAGFGFVILTLVIASIVPVVFGTWKYLGQYVGILNIPRPTAVSLPFGGHIEFITKTPYYYLALTLALISVLVLWAFYAGSTGRAWRAIGLSSQLAQSVGINPFRYRLVAFTLGSTIAGLMGTFYAVYAGSIVPGTFGPFKSIYVQIYAILGGMGFVILGPVVGALILTFIPELLRFLKGNEPIFTGALIILIVIFLPQGLLGFISSLRDKLTAGRIARRLRSGATSESAGPPGESGIPPDQSAAPVGDDA